MIFHKTAIPGLHIIDIEPHVDQRGFFARSYCCREFHEQGLHSNFVQSNISHNSLQGTLRGMHFQWPPHEEVKLVRCTSGALYDVVVDLRHGSPAFGEHFGVELSATSRRILYVPRGFAHGFLTLDDETEVAYQMGDYYEPHASDGFRWNDPAFQITWPAVPRHISPRDASYENVDVTRFKDVFTYDGT